MFSFGKGRERPSISSATDSILGMEGRLRGLRLRLPALSAAVERASANTAAVDWTALAGVLVAVLAVEAVALTVLLAAWAMPVDWAAHPAADLAVSVPATMLFQNAI